MKRLIREIVFAMGADIKKAASVALVPVIATIASISVIFLTVYSVSYLPDAVIRSDLFAIGFVFFLAFEILFGFWAYNVISRAREKIKEENETMIKSLKGTVSSTDGEVKNYFKESH